MLKINSFFLSRTAQHKERGNGQHHTNPLIEIQSFTEYQHSSHEHHHRTGGIDRSYNGYGQMFHSEISEYPRRQYDERLDDNIFMLFPTSNGNIEYCSSQQVRLINGYQDKR